METTWIGDWIRAARRHWGKSQEELGYAMHVTKSNVSAWENNRHAPSIGQLVGISELTGYDLPPEITKYAKSQELPEAQLLSTSIGDALGISAEALQIAKAYDALRYPEQRDAIKSLFKVLEIKLKS